MSPTTPCCWRCWRARTGSTRARYNVKTDAYTKALGGGVKGLKIGVVKEGFGHRNSERDVDAKVKQAANAFRDLGATVAEISVPMHAVGLAIWSPIALEGATELMMRGNGMGTNWRGLYTTSCSTLIRSGNIAPTNSPTR